MGGFNGSNMNLEVENEGKNYERRMTLQVSDAQKLQLTSGVEKVENTDPVAADLQAQNSMVS